MDPNPKAIELRAEQEGMKLEVLSWTRDLPWILQIFRNVGNFSFLVLEKYLSLKDSLECCFNPS